MHLPPVVVKRVAIYNVENRTTLSLIFLVYPLKKSKLWSTIN